MKPRILFTLFIFLSAQICVADSGPSFWERCQKILVSFFPSEVLFHSNTVAQIRADRLERTGRVFKEDGLLRESLMISASMAEYEQKYQLSPNGNTVYRGMYLPLRDLDLILSDAMDVSGRWKSIHLSTDPAEAILYLLPSKSDLSLLGSKDLYVSLLFEVAFDEIDRSRSAQGISSTIFKISEPLPASKIRRIFVVDFSKIRRLKESSLITFLPFNTYQRE